MEAAEAFQRLIHDRAGALLAGDVRIVRDGPAPGLLDFRHHLLCGRAVLTLSGRIASQIVDDDGGAAAGEQHGIGAAQAPAGTGDDSDFSIQA